MVAVPAGDLAALSAAERALSTVQESLPVALIATPRAHFTTCLKSESLPTAVDRARAANLDFLPVIIPGSHGADVIGGLLDVAAHGGCSPGTPTVGDAMQPLDEAHLIGANASIISFIRDSDRSPFRLVVSGREISGLVTRADLQRLPVRAALFAIVTQLEMLMADVIRIRFPEGNDWMACLSEARRQKLQEQLDAAESQDTIVEPLLYTQFGDKETIIKKTWPFPPKTVPSKSRFQNDMQHAQQLRDDLAHANNFAATAESIDRLSACIRAVDEWMGWLGELCATDRPLIAASPKGS